MNEIVVISGKGGTGKTSVTASFAVLGDKNLVVADCDVDAADMHLLLKPKILREEDFYSSYEAVISQDKCISCNRCFEVCRFDAIKVEGTEYSVIPLNCEGCAYCEKVCPTEAIEMRRRLDGKWFISQSKLGSWFVHAKLGIGTENSGKLVATVKNIARQVATMYGKEIILVDGSPGVGCPVISSLSGANLAVLVVEPSVSGLHDMKRVYKLIKRFQIPTVLIINKYDLNNNNTAEIKEFAEAEDIEIIARLPYDEAVVKAQTQGLTIVEYGESAVKSEIINAWEKIIKKIS